MLVDSHPKISCLLVAGPERFECFQRSYRCYLDQTYSNRELVIVNDGPPAYQRQLADHVQGRSDVRLVFLNNHYRLGALRNIAIGLCFGDLWVQWDDDDFNMPERLAIQCSHLLRHPHARACFLTEQLHYYFATRQLYWNNWRRVSGGYKKYGLIPGTIMAYKEGLPVRYPAVGDFAGAGEDSVMTTAWCRRNERQILLLSGCGHLYIYSFHGKNVWDVDHHLAISKVRGESCDFLQKHRSFITRTLDYMKFDAVVSVMGNDGLAFTYSVTK